VTEIRVTATDPHNSTASDEFELAVTAPSSGGTHGGGTPVDNTGGNITGGNNAGNAPARGGALDGSARDDVPGVGVALGPIDGVAPTPDDERNDEADQAADGRSDKLVDTLEPFLAQTSHPDFETALREAERSNRREPVLSAVEIARRWDAVARFGDWLAAQDDEDARSGAAPEWRLDQVLPGSGNFGGSAGPGGVTGIGQGAANLQLLKGLTEGLQKLGSS
jgi:hypothetical protein